MRPAITALAKKTKSVYLDYLTQTQPKPEPKLFKSHFKTDLIKPKKLKTVKVKEIDVEPSKPFNRELLNEFLNKRYSEMSKSEVKETET